MRSRGLVTPLCQLPHHEWQILQSNHVLAWTRHLVTATPCGVCRGCSRGGQRARPARGQCARGRGSSRGCRAWPTRRPGWRSCWSGGIRAARSTVGAPGCDGRDQKRVCNTSTCAVPTAPWRLLDRVEKRNPNGRARALRPQFEEDRLGAEEDASETIFGTRRTSKKMHVHSG